MKKIYTVKKINLQVKPLQEAWKNVPVINIDNFPWDNNGYRPKTEAKLFYTDTHFHIFFKSWENEIKITYHNMNDDVYKDSCVEFFIKPKPDSDSRYFNFEMNSIGTLLLGLGDNRYDRERIILDNPFEIFGISTSVTKDIVESYNNSESQNKFWAVEYSIPFTFIERYFGKLNIRPGYRLEGNFYKCGDETKFPHFGCWNPIKVESPDFHRPEFFGDLILE
ncbi:MAG: carbohydrate-binding family 9-like protein [Firmicutes bacterium]|nr:carbohydrate-binding family 9-like protein [Bacillota bacterium]